MRYLLLLLVFPLLALTPIHTQYGEERFIRDEFRNVIDNTQDIQFTVVVSTPVLSDLKDGEIVIVSSGTYNKLMFRQNQEVYSIDVSCVTVRR